MKNHTLLALIAAASLGGALTANADTRLYNTWRDGWFVQAGAGVNLPAMEGFRHEKKHVGATYNLAVGRWFTPHLAFRLGGNYGNIAEGQYNGTLHFRTASVNVDLMWDACNSLGGANLSRPVSVVPFLGLGGAYTTHYRGSALGNINVYNGAEHLSHSWTLPVSAGLQLRFRLCRYVDLFLEGRASFPGDNFNNIVGGAPVDVLMQATGGLTFNLGGKSFRAITPGADQSRLALLNDQVNALHEELVLTAAALAAAESQLPCPEVAPPAQPTAAVTVIEQAAPMLTTVRFALNSAQVSPAEMINVYNLAQYMNENPSTTITLTGYADKATGTEAYNRELSLRRAQAVGALLTDQYGIDPTRLTIAAEGSAVQPYANNAWNRIVIFSQD